MVIFKKRELVIYIYIYIYIINYNIDQFTILHYYNIKDL